MCRPVAQGLTYIQPESVGGGGAAETSAPAPAAAAAAAAAAMEGDDSTM